MVDALADEPVLLALIVVGLGAGIGAVRVRGVSLGPAAALFAGLAVGSIDESLSAAAGLDVRVGGGIRTARAFLRAGLVDELHVGIAPIVLDRGHRVWGDLRGLEQSHDVSTEVAESGTIHVTCTRKRNG